MLTPIESRWEKTCWNILRTDGYLQSSRWCVHLHLSRYLALPYYDNFIVFLVLPSAKFIFITLASTEASKNISSINRVNYIITVSYQLNVYVFCVKRLIMGYINMNVFSFITSLSRKLTVVNVREPGRFFKTLLVEGGILVALNAAEIRRDVLGVDSTKISWALNVCLVDGVIHHCQPLM